MSDDNSSLIISQLIKGLSDGMPEEERAKLAPYEARGAEAGSDKAAEWHRAYKCAKWAEQTVSIPAHHHLLAEAEKAVEVVKEVEKTIGGELGDVLEIPIGWAVSPRYEAEITWVYEAVHVAWHVAEKNGWDAVPWQALLDDVLSTPA
jgi:hypothetical protein